MKSTKCVACGFVGWSDVESCKACGASLNQYSTSPGANWSQSEGQEKGLAIVGLVLGIVGSFTLGILLVGAIVGTIVSFKAMGRVKREPWRYGGRGMAIAGLVLNILSLTSILPIALIAAISIPNLLAARMAANEGSAIHSLRQIAAAEAMYHENFDQYASLNDLATNGLIDPSLASGTKNGYNFAVELTTDEVNTPGFAVTGVPITYRSSGLRSFYVDESEVIRAGDNHGGPSTKMDEPLRSNYDYPPRARRFDEQPQAVY